jgi:hypothetical protein
VAPDMERICCRLTLLAPSTPAMPSRGTRICTDTAGAAGACQREREGERESEGRLA